MGASGPGQDATKGARSGAGASRIPRHGVRRGTGTHSHSGAGARTRSPAAPSSSRWATFRIGPEDVLDVQVWKNPELSRVIPVRPDGMISLPLVNDIRAAGLTPIELRQQVTQRLAEFIPSPEVSVIVREVHSVKVAVLGAVRMPGHYEVNSTATVLELIARAQGLTEFADRGRIVVLRQNGKATKRIPFNYRKSPKARSRTTSSCSLATSSSSLERLQCRVTFFGLF